jgi:hypothetical protein
VCSGATLGTWLSARCRRKSLRHESCPGKMWGHRVPYKSQKILRTKLYATATRMVSSCWENRTRCGLQMVSLPFNEAVHRLGVGGGGRYLQLDGDISSALAFLAVLRVILVLYGWETWCLTFREEHRLGMFENRVLRRFDWRGMMWTEGVQNYITRGFGTSWLPAV